MRKVIRLLDQFVAGILMLAMTLILLTVVWQVISRYVLADPASVTEELSRFLLIWIGLLGAAFAYRQKVHLGFNLIVEKQPPERRKYILTLVELLVIIFCASTLLFGGAQLVSLTLELEQISAALGVRMGYVYIVLPLSGALIICYGLINIHNLWLADEEEAW
ncbi:TRAP transporter small permease [Alteromonas lipolytica]|uniref:TRAP transporter small permease protein n=1 Tax=Alteromonas lipolytica TaxID=1856405 RepID=A0A1E8FHY1_9ALTE|nr:TRAP transporter small permease [Alteromonas lipolytica]OFI35557.1 C4-dicarboxylate ABC transporter permease [Alteromonas lipolytica]GGF77173.1 C4-dicarboxylate ABC transporter permease [Alteromonas lipolytica]